MGPAVRSTSSVRPRPAVIGASRTGSTKIGRTAVVALLVVIALLAGTSMAAADPDPTSTESVPSSPETAPLAPPADAPPVEPAPLSEPPLPDPSPQIRVVLARLAIIVGDRDVSLLTLAASGAQQAQADAEAAVAAADQQVEVARYALQVRRHQLGALAGVAFMRAGGGTMGSLIQDDPSFATRQQGMFDASLEHQNREVSDAAGTARRRGTRRGRRPTGGR